MDSRAIDLERACGAAYRTCFRDRIVYDRACERLRFAAEILQLVAAMIEGENMCSIRFDQETKNRRVELAYVVGPRRTL